MSFYKYLSAPGVDLLIRSRIRVCKLGQTNDKDEGLLEIEFPREPEFWKNTFEHSVDTDPFFQGAANLRAFDPDEYEKFKNLYAQRQCQLGGEDAEHVANMFREGFSRVVFFVSITKSFPNEVLWERYGDCHKGFVIEFDEGSYFFQSYAHDSGLLSTTMEIEYTEEKHVIQYGDTNPPFQLLYQKLRQDWGKEDEHRMFFFASFCEADGGHHYVRIPRDSILGVVLGKDCSPELRRQIEEANQQYYSGRLAISVAN